MYRRTVRGMIPCLKMWIYLNCLYFLPYFTFLLFALFEKHFSSFLVSFFSWSSSPILLCPNNWINERFKDGGRNWRTLFTIQVVKEKHFETALKVAWLPPCRTQQDHGPLAALRQKRSFTLVDSGKIVYPCRRFGKDRVRFGKIMGPGAPSKIVSAFRFGKDQVRFEGSGAFSSRKIDYSSRLFLKHRFPWACGWAGSALCDSTLPKITMRTVFKAPKNYVLLRIIKTLFLSVPFLKIKIIPFLKIIPS